MTTIRATNEDLPRTISVPEAGRILGVGRNSAYRAAARGDLPVVKVGGKLRVPTHRLRAILDGIDEAAAA